MSSRKKRSTRKPKVEQKVELPVPVLETEQESEHKQEQEPDTEIEDVSPKPTDKYKCDICDHTLLYKILLDIIRVKFT